MKKNRCAISFFFFLISSTSQARIDQICYDGISSKAIVSEESGVYSVELSGPLVDVLIEKGLVYSSGKMPKAITFKSKLRIDRQGAKIFQSDRYLTYSAHWEQDALVVEARGGSRGESQNWVLQNCQK